MTDGFQRRKEQSKEDIRKAAWELFGQFGVEKVSIADIAHRAGVSPATIYNNFGSKEALAREFAAGFIDQLMNQVEARLAPHKSFKERMATIVEFISETMAQGRQTGPSALVFDVGDLLDDPEIRAIRDAAQQRMTELLLGIIREGREQGEMRSDVSDDALRVYFGAFMDIFPSPDFTMLYRENPKVVQDVGSLMIHGLAGPEGRG